jgi:heme exporter protein D
MWHDEGVWIAVGVSALFVVVGLLMHRIFVRILKNGAIEHTQEKNHE